MNRIIYPWQFTQIDAFTLVPDETERGGLE